MLKLGIIGTGWITDSFIQGAQNSKMWTLAAVYSRTLEKASDFASKYQGEITPFDQIDEMIASDKVDAIYIASPNSLHFKYALKCLAAKKHVIVEKPIFSTVAELKQAHELAKANGVFLFEAARHIHEPNFKILKKELARLGKVSGATLVYMKYSSRYDKVLSGDSIPNIFSLDFSGGAIVDLGVYALYTAIALFGAPKKATYFAEKIHTGVDGHGTIILEYPAFNITIIQGKNQTSYLPSEIYGEKGTLVINPLTSIKELKFYDYHQDEAKELAGPVISNDMQFEAEEFARIIKENDQTSYQDLADLSLQVLHVSNELRHQNNIWFKGETNS
ncbi:Gfo/Idh/MocA family protein [Listeria sp. PSOL-1]|uniref:Gfo/Idh/MocA family protein n=1 Tax=Listeria sp. PSOL-1 TaxID=1844999 RepID=UPI0013D5D8A9|nr:Gfo/Idh/MocA family oxidoreductase [Listeria sp. PSOL-1]